MEALILVLAVTGIVWFLWWTRAKRRALREAELHQAWSTVLADPDYARRRVHEERKRDGQAHVHKGEPRPRKNDDV